MLFNLKSARAEYLVLIEIVYCAIKHSKVAIEEVLKKKSPLGPIIIHGHMDGLSLEVQ
jgi:hypothetical protein